MKKLLLLLAAVMALAVVAPAAHAYSKDSWSAPDKTLHQLYIRMDAIYDKRDRYGASPRMQDQISQLRYGIKDLTARVHNQYGDPKVARKKGDELSDLMTQVEAEYRDRARGKGKWRPY